MAAPVDSFRMYQPGRSASFGLIANDHLKSDQL